MSEPLFDFSQEYDSMLNEGLKLSGEDKSYFAAGRLAELGRRLPADFSPEGVLDFGCGTGETAQRLAALFPRAEIVGVDTSEGALAAARARAASAKLSFAPLSELPSLGSFDLCYVNGVFHHIEPERRPEALSAIRSVLRPGGWLALFENNPWNPGALWVMKRIPFDRDAKPFSPAAARRMLEGAGFSVAAQSSLFYFPKLLSPLRFLEPSLRAVPLGAQYLALARKP